VKTGSTQAGVRPSQVNQPTSAFAEKSVTILLTVIKRLHGFAVRGLLTDDD
jgi:hypothetical protein